MRIEMDNVVNGAPRAWQRLNQASRNGHSPMESALSLIGFQLRRAKDKKFTGTLTPNDKSDNLELIGQLKGIFISDTDKRIDSVRAWFKRMRSHMGLQRLGGQMEPILYDRLSIVERVLASLPPEPKIYPSDRDAAKKTEHEAGFFQTPDK